MPVYIEPTALLSEVIEKSDKSVADRIWELVEEMNGRMGSHIKGDPEPARPRPPIATECQSLRHWATYRPVKPGELPGAELVKDGTLKPGDLAVYVGKSGPNGQDMIRVGIPIAGTEAVAQLIEEVRADSMPIMVSRTADGCRTHTGENRMELPVESEFDAALVEKRVESVAARHGASVSGAVFIEHFVGLNEMMRGVPPQKKKALLLDMLAMALDTIIE